MLRSYNVELRHPEGKSSSTNVLVVSPDTQLDAREGLARRMPEAVMALGISGCSEQVRRAVAGCTAIDGKPLVIPLADGVSIFIAAKQMPGNADPIGFDTSAQDRGMHGIGASFQ